MLGDERRRTAKLLIVDDEPANVLLLRRVLQRAGYTALTSTNDPTEVLALCAQVQPDLILLDLTMPHKDGFAVLQELGAVLPHDAYLPVLVLTADPTPATRARALALGARDFLTKPFDFTEAVLRVNNLLETRFLYLQLQEANAELARQAREFQRFVAAPTATMIQRHEAIVSGVGEVREFAVLFSDMRGFTEIAHQLDPAAVFQVLSRSLEVQTSIVLGYAGQVDKIYGDGFLAYFDGEDKAERAVRCAVSIRAAVQALGRDEGGPQPPVGLGVAVGRVLFGLLGTADRMEHTLVGDVVNVCARLCGIAKPFQIVVTEEVRAVAAHSVGVTFRPLGAVTLKGKPSPLPVYEVEVAADETDR